MFNEQAVATTDTEEECHPSAVKEQCKTNKQVKLNIPKGIMEM